MIAIKIWRECRMTWAKNSSSKLKIMVEDVRLNKTAKPICKKTSRMLII